MEDVPALASCQSFSASLPQAGKQSRKKRKKIPRFVFSLKARKRTSEPHLSAPSPHSHHPLLRTTKLQSSSLPKVPFLKIPMLSTLSSLTSRDGPVHLHLTFTLSPHRSASFLTSHPSFTHCLSELVVRPTDDQPSCSSTAS